MTQKQINDVWLTASGNYVKITKITHGELCKADIYETPDCNGQPLIFNTNCTNGWLIKEITKEKYPEHWL